MWVYIICWLLIRMINSSRIVCKGKNFWPQAPSVSMPDLDTLTMLDKVFKQWIFFPCNFLQPYVTFSRTQKYSSQHVSFKRSQSMIISWSHLNRKTGLRNSVNGFIHCVIIVQRNGNSVRLVKSSCCRHKIKCNISHPSKTRSAITD